jgi:hypothetical protein
LAEPYILKTPRNSGSHVSESYYFFDNNFSILEELHSTKYFSKSYSVRVTFASFEPKLLILMQSPEIHQKIPRTIWMLWFQGLTAAPLIVKECVKSWENKNPDWNLVVLNLDNLHKYIQIDLTEKKLATLSVQHKSDLIRLKLLSTYGGVWADATTFCMYPLTSWIDECSTSGFFAFYKPGPDRIMSNWFMVSEKGSPIVSELYEKLILYWEKNDFEAPNRFQKKIRKKLNSVLSLNEVTAKIWLTPVVTKLLKIYPYYVFHYIFENIVSTSQTSRLIWTNTKKVSAEAPHKIQEHGLMSPLTDSIKSHIDNKETPLYKLNWRKCDPDLNLSDTTISYLLQNGK